MTTNVEALCARCARPYFTEVVDNGLCCICNRDDYYEAYYGSAWRIIVRQMERASVRP